MLLFCLFSAALNFNCSRKGGRHWLSYYSEAGLQRISLSGKQKEIPSPPIAMSLHPRIAGSSGLRQNQEHIAYYKADIISKHHSCTLMRSISA